MTREFRIALTSPKPRDRSPRQRRRRGFTLIEGLTAAVILAILVLGVFGSLSVAYEQSASVRANATGILLARQLTDEIGCKPFSLIGSYNNYSDVSTSIPMLAGGSVNATGSDAYNRNVSVVTGVVPSTDAISPTSDFAIVTVSVTCPNGQIISVPELVANYPVQAN